MIKKQTGRQAGLHEEGRQSSYREVLKEGRQSSYREALKEGRLLLRQAGIEEYEIDAWYLFEECFQMNRGDFFLRQEQKAPAERLKQYENLLQERKKRVPLQQILGKQEFMGFSFAVDKNVLIPRQDTELLVETVMKEAENKSVLDMCTGSGCIILSLAKLVSLKKAVGADVSGQALAIAERNRKALRAEAIFLQSDLFKQVADRFDILVSNPPYIESGQIRMLQPEVKEHEPLLALDGGEDGLFFYRNIIGEAPEYLHEGGKIFLEIGYNQAQAVSALLEDAGFEEIQIIKDLAGLDRVVRASLQK